MFSGQTDSILGITLPQGLNSATDSTTPLNSSNRYQLENDAGIVGAGNPLTISIGGGTPTTRLPNEQWSEGGYNWEIRYSGDCKPNPY